MAERQGFEPWVLVRAQRFSNPTRSLPTSVPTLKPPLEACKYASNANKLQFFRTFCHHHSMKRLLPVLMGLVTGDQPRKLTIFVTVK